MKKKTKQEIDEFAQNVADAISEQFTPEKQIDVVQLIQRKVFANNVKILVEQEVKDYSNYLVKILKSENKISNRITINKEMTEQINPLKIVIDGKQ